MVESLILNGEQALDSLFLQYLNALAAFYELPKLPARLVHQAVVALDFFLANRLRLKVVFWLSLHFKLICCSC